MKLSGPGVRIALYLQSLLSIVLIRYSPADAPGAYWCMTSTALSLVISAIITSIHRSISLLDAIVVVYGTSPQPSNSTHSNILNYVNSPSPSHPSISIRHIRNHFGLRKQARPAESPFTPPHRRQLDAFSLHLLLRHLRLGNGAYLRFRPPRMQHGYQTHLLWRKSACARERPRA